LTIVSCHRPSSIEQSKDTATNQPSTMTKEAMPPNIQHEEPRRGAARHVTPSSAATATTTAGVVAPEIEMDALPAGAARARCKKQAILDEAHPKGECQSGRAKWRAEQAKLRSRPQQEQDGKTSLRCVLPVKNKIQAAGSCCPPCGATTASATTTTAEGAGDSTPMDRATPLVSAVRQSLAAFKVAPPARDDEGQKRRGKLLKQARTEEAVDSIKAKQQEDRNGRWKQQVERDKEALDAMFEAACDTNFDAAFDAVFGAAIGAQFDARFNAVLDAELGAARAARFKADVKTDQHKAQLVEEEKAKWKAREKGKVKAKLRVHLQAELKEILRIAKRCHQQEQAEHQRLRGTRPARIADQMAAEHHRPVNFFNDLFHDLFCL
jgi:hypothetical protein